MLSLASEKLVNTHDLVGDTNRCEGCGVSSFVGNRSFYRRIGAGSTESSGKRKADDGAI